MVAVAAKRAGAHAQVSSAMFDQSAIGFGDASFDAVINRHGLMFVENPVQTVSEAVRVLRAGGRYAVMTWDRREANPWLGLMLDAVSAQFGVPFPPPNARGPFSLDTPDALLSVLRDGGLDEINVTAMSTPMHAASIEEWWERVPKLAGPLALALAGMDADVRDPIRERATQTAANAAASEGDGIVFDGSVADRSERSVLIEPMSSDPAGRPRLHLSGVCSRPRRLASQEPSQMLGGGKRRLRDRKTALVELEWVRGQTTSALAARTRSERSRLAPYQSQPRTTANAGSLPRRLHHQAPNSPAPTAASVSRASWRCCSTSRSDQASNHSAALYKVESSLASIASSTSENVVPCSIMASTWC